MGSSAQGYVKEFTRHSRDILRNLDELRKRQILTDVCLLVDGRQLRAHKLVLMACSGYFYSMFSTQGSADQSVLSLPDGIELRGFQVLLDFMYTSCLALSLDSIRSVLAAAEFLRMDHVMDTCQHFIQTSSPVFGTACKLVRNVLCTISTANGVPVPWHQKVHVRGTSHAMDLPTSSASTLLSSVPFSVTPQTMVFGRLPKNTQKGDGTMVERKRNSFDHSSLCLTPSVTADFADASPVQDHEGAHPHTVEIQRVLNPSQRAHTTLTAASTAFDSCQRGSVLRRPDSCDWSPAELGGIQVPVCAFQKASGLSDSAADTPAMFQAGSVQSDPAGRECVHQMKEEPVGAGEGRKENDRAQNYAKISILTPSSPTRSDGHPNSPTESSTVKCHSGLNNPDPKACNWKKYKFIVLNSMKQEKEEVQQGPVLMTGKPAVSYPFRSVARDGAVSGEDAGAKPDGNQQFNLHLGYPIRSSPCCFVCGQHFLGLPQLRHHMLYSHPGEEPTGYPPERTDYRTGEKPYRCCVCSAQFNRPANLKTHSRIHSGEKPYKCETCGSCFVQVAHLRAHVLIHTGEKPYPCETCGTRFRHLQTLKSHIRIHTGEKPYHCKMCELHFRHKSQLRLHLRQKHGAITNTKIRYKVLSGPYAAAIGAF